MHLVAALVALSLLSGCASTFMSDNRTSRIWITASCGAVSNVGARCIMSGQGQRAAFDLPAEVVVGNSWSPLTLQCEGDLLGSASTTVVAKPNVGMAGNLLLGGVPGALIDSATGRGFNYDRRVNLHRTACLR